ncbi:MAG: hypothetical protein QW343_03665, partial [Candidatus Norongarragalinales archaeon]
MRASLEGFKEAKERIKYPEKKTVRFELKCSSEACAVSPPSSATPTPSSSSAISFSDKAKLVVTLSDAKTAKIVDGRVSVYNAKSNSLVGTAVSIGGQASLELDAGMRVFANAEADGYLPFDGSKNAVLLKAGKNSLAIKLTPLVQGGCRDGTNASCVTPDGYAGTKTCVAGTYGECTANYGDCTAGQSIVCTTSDNCPGRMTCGAQGAYGSCVKDNPSCSSRCTPGQKISCTTREGFNGSMVCNSSGFFESCARVPLECTAGASIACVTTDACNGTQSCNASGFWGECVKRTPLECEGAANYATSIVRVFAANGSAVAQAKIDVFNSSNAATPLVRDKHTNANGYIELNLSNAAGNTYFAVAAKEGFFDEASGNFSAGESVNITLTPITPENTARIEASAFDDERVAVNGADFVLFTTNVKGQLYRVAERSASTTKNLVSFDGLRRGSSVMVNASKGAAFGSTNAVLAAENNFVNVTLAAPLALLRFQAVDLETSEPIESAQFAVTRLGANVGSCLGVNCTVAIRSGRFYNASAAARSFLPESFEFENVKALPEQEVNLTAEMLALDAVEQTAASLQGVFEVETGLPATHLVAGREYAARFQLAAKPGLEGTGLHVAFAEEEIAFFTGYSPRAAVELASASSEESGCEGADGVEKPLDFKENKYEWLDLEYDGSRNSVVEAKFKISPDASLDPRTHQGKLTLRWRSFGRKGEGAATKIYRNPFDATLGVELDSPLESGCNAESLEKKLPVSATTCDDYSCLWLSFEQGEKEGGDGFEAKSMKRVNPESKDYKPLLVHYAIDFLKQPKQLEGLKLAFTAPQANLAFKKHSDPLADASDCGSQKEFVLDSSGSWQLDLTRVAQCSNYGRFPLRLEGIAEAVPLEPSDKVDLQLVLASSTTELLKKKSWLKIASSEAGQPPTGDAAVLSLLLSQTQKGEEVKESKDSNDIFSAGAVTVDAQLHLSPTPQPYSFVYGEYSAKANYDVYDAALEISVPNAAQSPLRFVGVLPAKGGFIAARDGVVRIAAGELKKSEKISGKAVFAPVLTGAALQRGYAYGQIVLRFTASDWDGAALAQVERAAKQVFVAKEVTPPATGEKTTWFSPGEDNCGGFISITYDAVNGLNLGGCTDLGMQVSSVLPADAVPVKVQLGNARLLAKVESATKRTTSIWKVQRLYRVGVKELEFAVEQGAVEQGDPSCLDLSGLLEGNGDKVLKYDATRCVKKEFKLLGNNMVGQDFKIKFWVSGVGDPAADCNSNGVACLNVHVQPLSGINSLEVRRIATVFDYDLGVEDKQKPEFWAFTNNRQYPETRTLEIRVEGEEEPRKLVLKAGETKVLAAKPLVAIVGNELKQGSGFKVFEEKELVFETSLDTAQFSEGEPDVFRDTCYAPCLNTYYICSFYCWAVEDEEREECEQECS